MILKGRNDLHEKYINAYIGQAELYGFTGATTNWVFGQHITAFNKFLER